MLPIGESVRRQSFGLSLCSGVSTTPGATVFKRMPSLAYSIARFFEMDSMPPLVIIGTEAVTPASVSASAIILKSARGKFPSWGAWDILKATWLTWSRCLKEGTHGSTRGTIHDQRDVSQGGLGQRNCASDRTRSQNHS